MGKCPYCKRQRTTNTRGLMMATCGSESCRRAQRRDAKRRERGTGGDVAQGHAVDPVRPDGPVTAPDGRTFTSARTAWIEVCRRKDEDLEAWLSEAHPNAEPSSIEALNEICGIGPEDDPFGSAWVEDVS